MSNDQDDFWGDDPKWDTDPSGALPTRGNTGAAIKSWWSSLLGAGAGASAHRSHGSSSGSDTPADELAADPYDLVGIGASDDVASDDVVSDDGAAATMAADINATTEIPVVRAGGEQADWDAAWDSADDRGSAPVDPLLARMGALAIVVTLLVPIGLSMRSGGGDDLIESAVATESSAVTSPTVVVTVEAEPVATAESSTEETSAAPAADSTAAPAAVAEPASSTASETSAAEAPAEATAERSGGDETLDTSAAAGEAADRVERPCPIEYEVVQGDFWIRLAERVRRPARRSARGERRVDPQPAVPRRDDLPAGRCDHPAAARRHHDGTDHDRRPDHDHDRCDHDDQHDHDHDGAADHDAGGARGDQADDP